MERDAEAFCAGFDPDAVPSPEVVSIFETSTRLARLFEGLALRTARRLDDAGAATAAGARSTAEYLATATGTSVGAAQDLLVTSQRLASQAHTDAAVARGQLSGDAGPDRHRRRGGRPDRRAGAARHRPSASRSRTCGRSAGTIKANAHPDPGAHRERIRRARSCRTWTDQRRRLEPDHAPPARGRRRDRRAAGTVRARPPRGRPPSGDWESRDAYQADAPVGPRPGLQVPARAPKGARRADTKVFVHIDAETLLTGERHARSPSARSTASAPSTSTTSARCSATPSSSP